MSAKVMGAAGLLLLGVSSCYYLISYLPQMERQRSAADARTAQLRNQQECSTRAEHYFKESPYGKRSDSIYENHFNTKENRCFILIQQYSYSTTQSFHDILIDAYDGDDLGQYLVYIPQGKTEDEMKPYCQMLGKDCHNVGEFKEFVKQYMEHDVLQ